MVAARRCISQELREPLDGLHLRLLEIADALHAGGKTIDLFVVAYNAIRRELIQPVEVLSQYLERTQEVRFQIGDFLAGGSDFLSHVSHFI